MNCPSCEQEVPLEVRVSGGCQGGHSEDGYCYCDALDARVQYTCCNKRCNAWGQVRIIPELSDQYSIERWLNKNYIP